MKKQKIPKKTNLVLQRINLKVLDVLLQNGPFTIYVDRFYLWNKGENAYYRYHWPHFIIILSKNKKKYLIIDPDTGKKRFIDSQKLYKSITELKKRLWFCPQAIQIT